MTRGTLAIILPEGIFCSTEFNGDMGIDGLGKDAIEYLNRVKSLEGFKSEVESFNAKYFKYTEDEFVYKMEDGFDLENSFFEKNYFETWFSDYVYILNLTTDDISVIDYDGNKVTIFENIVNIFNFGVKRYLNTNSK